VFGRGKLSPHTPCYVPPTGDRIPTPGIADPLPKPRTEFSQRTHPSTEHESRILVPPESR